MDDGARGWLVKTATKNFWRVARWYDLDDLIQDGFVCYYKVMLKYPTAIDAPHRMALFKRTYTNYIHDLSTSRTKSVAEFLASDLTPQDAEGGERSEMIAASIPCPHSDMVSVGAILATAPERVRRVLALFADDEDRVALRSAYRLRRIGKRLVRETLNERLCRILGYDPAETDLVGEVHRFLTA